MKKIWYKHMDPTKIAEITSRAHTKTYHFLHLHAKHGNSTVQGQRWHQAAAVADLLNVALADTAHEANACSAGI
jgi:hypothetical protein